MTTNHTTIHRIFMSPDELGGEIDETQLIDGLIQLEAVHVLREGDGECLKGAKGEEVLLERFRDSGIVLGERHAHALLNRPHLIPKALQGKVLLFPGSLKATPPHGRLQIPVLGHHDKIWTLGWRLLTKRYDGQHRIMRLATTSTVRTEEVGTG